MFKYEKLSTERAKILAEHQKQIFDLLKIIENFPQKTKFEFRNLTQEKEISYGFVTCTRQVNNDPRIFLKIDGEDHGRSVSPINFCQMTGISHKNNQGRYVLNQEKIDYYLGLNTIQTDQLD